MPNIRAELIAEAEVLLTPAEVAALFRVDRATVTRWSSEGKLPCIKLPSGHRRYRETDVNAILEGEIPPSLRDKED